MSRPTIFCNACGVEVDIDRSMGGSFLGYRVCSPGCAREARWRDTLHIMKKDYRPDPEPLAGGAWDTEPGTKNAG
jgi:hypothetical protein